jgi:hypothetical protein
MKVNRCAAVGIASRRVDLPTSTSTEHLVQVLGALSADVTRLRINKDYLHIKHLRMSAACAEVRANRDAQSSGCPDDVGVDWNEQTRAGLETALNEAEVVGLRTALSDSACELLLHVCAQSEQVAKDPDPRRVLRLLRATRIRVLLREDRQGGYGPAIPLAGLDEVESFFTSLGGWEAMYGWEFLDRPSRTGDWPEKPSLTVDLRPGRSSHSLFWFTECWRPDDARYCIEGTVDFDDLEVLRADGAREPVEEFVAEGRRWWDVLFGRSGQPPQAQVTPAEAPSWREHRRGSTFVGDER